MKAVLVFCEGRHDIVFVQRSLGAVAGCAWLNTRLGELPSPFGVTPGIPKGFIAQRYYNRQLDALNLQMARHPPLPSFESALEHQPSDTIYLMVRAHGQDQPVSVTDLLSDLDATFDAASPGTLDVDRYAAAFFFDANDVGVTATIDTFRSHYEHLGLDALSNKSWVSTRRIPVGCFVFHQDGKETGTLEDHLGPMVEATWPDQSRASATFIDGTKTPDDRVSRKSSERWKAVITAAGQFDHPGDPLSVIIGRNGLPRDPFESSALCRELVDFLTSVPWDQPPAATDSDVDGAASS